MGITPTEEIYTMVLNLPVNGKYQIPDLPGIGQELTDKSIAESPKETVK